MFTKLKLKSMMEETFEILLREEYKCRIIDLQKLVKSNLIFELTGADQIEGNMSLNSLFSLHFHQRGKIFGKVISATENEFNLEWNVTGFNKPDEVKTIVKIKLIENRTSSSLEIKHSLIKNYKAKLAKEKAWREILENIKNKISTFS